MPETETIHTEYGEVEAQTETCHKCGEKKLAENTMDLLMGKRIKSWDCAEYELGYSTPAGVDGRHFPKTREVAMKYLGSILAGLSSAVTAGVFLL